MKRDWDLIRDLLAGVEDEADLFVKLSSEPKWTDQLWEDYERQLKDYRVIEGRLFGHLELLVESGYIDGLQIIRLADGSFGYGLHSPRLTMAGHDLLATIRSSTVWEKIKALAKTKGIELSFDAVKVLGALAIKGVLS